MHRFYQWIWNLIYKIYDVQNKQFSSLCFKEVFCYEDLKENIVALINCQHKFNKYKKEYEREHKKKYVYHLDVPWGEVSGYNVEDDEEKAVESYRKAAEQGDPVGLYNLALHYEEGVGIEQDFEQALHHYHLAAESNYAPAQNKIGAYYAEGNVVEQDFKQALHWCLLAAKQGYAPAQFSLGKIYYHGLGVEKDIEEAEYWLGLAANQGHKEAQSFLKENTKINNED